MSILFCIATLKMTKTKRLLGVKKSWNLHAEKLRLTSYFCWRPVSQSLSSGELSWCFSFKYGGAVWDLQVTCSAKTVCRRQKESRVPTQKKTSGHCLFRSQVHHLVWLLLACFLLGLSKGLENLQRACLRSLICPPEVGTQILRSEAHALDLRRKL